MPQTSLEGPALRALAARAGQPPFVPPTPAERPRDRIWELAETLHCSVVGTCLTTEDARALLAKLNRPDARTMSEHRLHGEVVRVAGRRDAGGRLLQKTLDRRHEREIRRFDRVGTADGVRALWREALEQGEVPGAYWAAITHPATDWPLVQDIFGEVHMLSHLVGRSNRADLRRLARLETDLAARDAAVAEGEARIRALTEERDRLHAQDRAAVSRQAVAAARPEPVPADPGGDPRAEFEVRLARERGHAEALAERVAVLMRAVDRLGAELEAEIARRRAAEDERAALEGLLDRETPDGEAPEAGADPLAGRSLLYVGGRPRQVAHLRRFVEARGGRLLHHDGGLEESMTLLPGLVGQCDLVLFPVACVSHEATARVKRACEAVGRPFRPLRGAGLASFAAALVQALPPASPPADG